MFKIYFSKGRKKGDEDYEENLYQELWFGHISTYIWLGEHITNMIISSFG